MSNGKKIIDDLFHGERELAISVLNEINNMKVSIDAISKMLNQELPIDKNKKMMKALAESYGNIVAGIIIPINLKYPDIQ